MICKIIGLFANTLTADNKYSLLNRDKSTQPIQMQLSQKQNYFCEFFSQRFKSSLNFEQFFKKDDRHSWCISEIMDSKKQVRSMSNKSRFRGHFEKQHDKLAKTLLKSERQHFYHIYWSLWKQLSWKKSLLGIFKTLRLFLTHWLKMKTILFLIKTV